MSLFGRALAGLGQGAGQLASQYITQAMEQQKAQFLSELQYQNMVRADEYTRGPARLKSIRGEKAEDIMAEAAAKDRAALATAGNTRLTEAEIERANRITSGTSDAVAAAAGAKQGAVSRNTVRELSPGQIATVGGKTVAENPRSTAQEVNERLYREGLKSGKGTDKMSEAGKVQLQGILRTEQELDQEFNKASFQNPDAAKDDSPAMRRYMQQKAALFIQKQRVLASEGVIDGAEDGAAAVQNERNPDKLMTAKAQAQMVGGDYGKDFAAVIDRALADMFPADRKRSLIEAAARKAGDKKYDMQIGGGSVEHVTATPNRPAAVSGGASRATSSLDDVDPSIRAAVADAQTELNRWGSVQRQRDPEGFARAQAGLRSAKQALDDAMEKLIYPPEMLRPSTRISAP